MRCGQCGVGDVIQIKLKLPNGSEVLFCACHKCEHKWWDRNGESLGLSEVLELARQTSQ